MTKQLRDGRPVLLAGLLLALTPIRLYAADRCGQDAPRMPPSAAAFITLRPACLAEKMGVKEPSKSLPWLKEWKHSVGLPMTSLERCTIVFQSLDSYCWVLQTVRPYHRQTVLKAWAPDAKAVKRNGKVFHVGATGATVHFIDPQTLIVANREETVVWWLVSGPVARSSTDKGFRKFLVDMGAELDAPPENTEKARTMLKAARTALTDGKIDEAKKLALNARNLHPTLHFWEDNPDRVDADIRTAEATVQKDAAPAKASAPAAAPREAGRQKGLMLCDSDTPVLAAWRLADKHDLVAWTRIDVLAAYCPEKPAVSASCRLPERSQRRASYKRCVAPPVGEATPDATSTILKWQLPLVTLSLESVLMTLDVGEKVNIDARLTCLDAGSAVQVSKVLRAGRDLIRAEVLGMAALGPLARFADKPVERMPAALLLRKTAKALERVRIQPEGNSIPLSLQIDLDAKRFRSELIACGKLIDDQTDKEAAPHEEAVSAPPPPPCPAASEVLSNAPAPPPPPAAAVARSVLTVANVTKDSALLFIMTDSGKLIFAKEVPAGDAMDFEATTGQRWVAVFKSGRPRQWTAAEGQSRPGQAPVQQAGLTTSLPTRFAAESSSQPVGETFTPAKAKEIWLLR